MHVACTPYGKLTIEPRRNILTFNDTDRRQMSNTSMAISIRKMKKLPSIIRTLTPPQSPLRRDQRNMKSQCDTDSHHDRHNHILSGNNNFVPSGALCVSAVHVKEPRVSAGCEAWGGTRGHFYKGSCMRGERWAAYLLGGLVKLCDISIRLSQSVFTPYEYRMIPFSLQYSASLKVRKYTQRSFASSFGVTTQ